MASHKTFEAYASNVELSMESIDQNKDSYDYVMAVYLFLSI